MIGGICFDHANCIDLVILDESKLVIVDSLHIDIDNQGQDDVADYTIAFSPLKTWLSKYNEIKHCYCGPRLTGIAPKFKSKDQGAPHEPSNDSRAFLDVIRPYKKIISQARPKPSDITICKPATEVVFKISSSDVGKIWATCIAIKAVKGMNYRDVNTFLKKTDEYSACIEFIKLTLPPSSRKRYGLNTLIKAQASWKNPNSKLAKAQSALESADVAKFEKIANYKISS